MPVTTPPAINPALISQLTAAASAAGIPVLAAEPAVSFAGDPTTRFTLAPTVNSGAAQTLQLELSNTFNPSHPEFAEALEHFLAETANRLRNPRPNTFLTLTGIPLSYSAFAWPFHESTAGADTSLVHGQINLEDGEASILHAKIAAAMTVTFRDIVRAPEQPFAESFILNAVRKTLDQGQLELGGELPEVSGCHHHFRSEEPRVRRVPRNGRPDQHDLLGEPRDLQLLGSPARRAVRRAVASDRGRLTRVRNLD